MSCAECFGKKQYKISRNELDTFHNEFDGWYLEIRTCSLCGEEGEEAENDNEDTQEVVVIFLCPHCGLPMERTPAEEACGTRLCRGRAIWVCYRHDRNLPDPKLPITLSGQVYRCGIHIITVP